MMTVKGWWFSRQVEQCTVGNFFTRWFCFQLRPPVVLERNVTREGLSLLLDVGFNREVAEDTALYWTKKPGSLAALIEQADKILPSEAQAWGEKAKQRVKTAYSWQKIGQEYEKVFAEDRNSAHNV